MRLMLQNDAIWGLIALFLTNQNAGNTIDFKMNVIKQITNYKCYNEKISRAIITIQILTKIS